MRDVMKCLEDSLVPTVISDKEITCKQLNRKALNTHPYCYVRSGFCALPFSDLFAVVEIIGLKAFLHVESFKLVFVTGGICSLYYAGVVADTILPWSHDAKLIANETIMHFSEEQLSKVVNKQS